MSACTTYHSTFVEDLETCRALGIQGIGLWEYKLPDGRDAANVESFKKGGLTATFCFPNVPGVIAGDVLFSTPKERKERLVLLKAGIRRLARFDPVAVGCLAGSVREVSPVTAWKWAVEGLREAAYVAGEAGVKLALEVVRPGPGGSLVSTIPQALEMIADIGVGNVDVLVDTWHSWDAPGTISDIRQHAGRIVGVQVNDAPRQARGPMDRLLPGTGRMDLATILRALRQSGFRGWYELEIFSDDGTFGRALPDSLWRLKPADLLRAGRDSFDVVWRSSFTSPE